MLEWRALTVLSSGQQGQPSPETLRAWPSPGMRDRVEVLERRSKRVREAPHRPRSELLVLGREVLLVHVARQVFRRLEFAFHERPIDDDLGEFVAKLGLLPLADLLGDRFEVPLHAIHANRDSINQAEMLRVLGKHRREVAVEGHVVADEHTVADGHRKAHGLVVGVPDADGEVDARNAVLKTQHAEHLHAVQGNGLFVPDHVDVPEASSREPAKRKVSRPGVHIQALAFKGDHGFAQMAA